jgi:hypothetical protein
MTQARVHEVAALPPEQQAAALEEKETDAKPKSTDDYLKRANAEFNHVQKLLNEAMKELRLLANGEFGKYLIASIANTSAKQVRNLLRKSVPSSRCKRCKSKGCVVCQMSGYITEGMSEPIS